MVRFLAFGLLILPLTMLQAPAYAADDLLPPRQDRPLTDYSKTQMGNAEEVEKKFGTAVNQTILDRGNGEIEQRDRLGTGRAGVFYEHGRDDRLNDSDDTIGVQFKLFDLND